MVVLFLLIDAGDDVLSICQSRALLGCRSCNFCTAAIIHSAILYSLYILDTGRASEYCTIALRGKIDEPFRLMYCAGALGIVFYRCYTYPPAFATRANNRERQLAQCRFPGLAISNAKILIYFSNKPNWSALQSHCNAVHAFRTRVQFISDAQHDKLTVDRRKYCQLSSTDEGWVYKTIYTVSVHLCQTKLLTLSDVDVPCIAKFCKFSVWGKVPGGSSTLIFESIRISLKTQCSCRRWSRYRRKPFFPKPAEFIYPCRHSSDLWKTYRHRHVWWQWRNFVPYLCLLVFAPSCR